MCLSDCSASCYRQNTTHLYAFWPREPTQRCFTLPAFVRPSPLALESCPSARTVRLDPYHFPVSCSPVWPVGESANPLRSNPFGVFPILSDLSTDLPDSARFVARTPDATVQDRHRWWWLVYMDCCQRAGRDPTLWVCCQTYPTSVYARSAEANSSFLHQARFGVKHQKGQWRTFIGPVRACGSMHPFRQRLLHLLPRGAAGSPAFGAAPGRTRLLTDHRFFEAGSPIR